MKKQSIRVDINRLGRQLQAVIQFGNRHFQIFLLKASYMFTRNTLKREIFKASPNGVVASGAEWSFSIPARGIFLKRRTAFNRILFRCFITRKLILKSLNLSFCIGQFFLGYFVRGSEYIQLIVNEADALSKNIGSHGASDAISELTSKSKDGIEVHSNPRND